ncbi:MAG: trypsin-like peptidase domain-containing protein [Terracidiphilus sp.]
MNSTLGEQKTKDDDRDKIWVTRYSTSGIAYQMPENPVPAIDPNVLQSVFYIYPDVASAEKALATGGTGFFAGVPLEANPHMKMIYAVTNWHCIEKSDPRVILRVNKKNGEPDCIPTEISDWKPHPDKLDIAATPIMLSPDYEYNFVSSDMFFVTPETVRHRQIGPGDDVFMVGRFMGHDGKQGNLPTARFGNISRMNSEPLEDRHGNPQDSFLVEMKSIPGYSGSPVFVYINPTLARPPYFMTPLAHPYNQAQHGPWLLGIDWSHLSDFHPILLANRQTKKSPQEWVEVNTGMAGVIPAWRIQELLDLEEFKMQRKEKDDEFSNYSRLAGSPSEDSAGGDHSFTQQDFEADLRNVSRKVSPSKSDGETK